MIIEKVYAFGNDKIVVDAFGDGDGGIDYNNKITIRKESDGAIIKGAPARVLMVLIECKRMPLDENDVRLCGTKLKSHKNTINEFLGDNAHWLKSRPAMFFPPEDEFYEISTPVNGTKSSDYDGNFKILKKWCGHIPTVSFLGEHGSVDIGDMFVPPRFQQGSSIKTIFDEIYSDEQQTASQGCVITGRQGSGRTTLLNAIVMRHVDSSEETKFHWFGAEDRIPQNAIIFVMRISEISNAYEKSFYGYVRASINATESTTSQNHILNPKSQGFIKKIEDCCESKNGNVLFLIDGIEDFTSNSLASAEEKRSAFLDSLVAFANEHNNIKYIITATPPVVDERSCLSNVPKYHIAAPTDSDIRCYCQKWVKLFPMNHLSSDKLTKMIIDNTALRSTLDTAQMVMFCLTAIKIDGGNTQYYSQMHLMKVIASTCLNVTVNGYDKYDFIIPLSLLALKFCEKNINGLTMYDANPSVESILTNSKNHKLMSAFLTYKADAANDRFKQFVCMGKKFPLIKISEGENSRLDFSAATWRTYYAAYALSQGLIDCSLSEYIEKRMEVLCKASGESRDDENAVMWISIIARAAKLSRRGAEDIVKVLIKYASDFTPKRRRGREIAVCALLKINRNRSFISEELREKSYFEALSYYFYFNEIDDVLALITSSCYRREIAEYMFIQFMQSIDSMSSIPTFLWVLGYLTLRFTDLSIWNGDLQFAKAKMLVNSEMRNDCTEKNASSAIERYTDGFSEFSLQGKILYTLCCASLMWQTYGLRSKTNIGQVKHARINSVDVSFNTKKYQQFFLDMLCEDDFRLSNTAGYALTHLTTAQLDGMYSEDIIAILSTDEMLCSILRSDYAARKAYIAYDTKNPPNENRNPQPFCGALRLLTTLSPKTGQYGLARRIAANVSSFYREIWDNYYAIINTNDDLNVIDNAKRYLMLVFKLCYLTAAFGDDVKDCIGPIERMWKLKYPEMHITECINKQNAMPNNGIILGLDYDNEDDFFRYLSLLYNQIAE